MLKWILKRKTKEVKQWEDDIVEWGDWIMVEVYRERIYLWIEQNPEEVVKRFVKTMRPQKDGWTFIVKDNNAIVADKHYFPCKFSELAEERIKLLNWLREETARLDRMYWFFEEKIKALKGKE